MRLKKILLGAVLIALAGFAAFCVKEAMDLRHPEYAVARLEVTADSEPVDVTIAGFNWSFFFSNKNARQMQDVALMSVPSTELLGGETLELKFSLAPESYEIKRSESYSYSFIDIGGDLTVPYSSGAYLYQVDAVFDRGTARYYFYIIVQ